MIDRDEFNQALFSRVRALRCARGLSQSQTAAALGLPIESYIHYEKRSPLPAHLMPAFAALVGVNLDYLLTGEN
jgi:transcriptional regulator with XRE-family HTH domain